MPSSGSPSAVWCGRSSSRCCGTCPACADSKGCGSNLDCESKVCLGNVCQAPACDDGVPNGEDACPDEPGKKDKDPRRNGCPAAFIKDGQIKILDQVKFASSSTAIAVAPASTEPMLRSPV